MKYIKLFEQHKNNDIILPKGTVLYHGTIEDFDIKNITTGGYDNIFWTTKDSAIADTYIPDSGSSVYISTDTLVYPVSEGDLRNLQKEIGIEYDYDQVKFKGSKAISYPIAPIFKSIDEEEYKWSEESMRVDSLFREKTKEINDIYDKIETREELDKIQKKVDQLHKEITELSNRKEELSNMYNDMRSDIKMREVVNNYLKNELNYEPKNENSDGNHSWKIKINDNKILKSDENAKGRLLIITLQRDFKIYDMTDGGRIEGDLMNLQYHSHSVFKSAVDNGYDGVRINDFAQIEGVGNFGHTSYGIFEHAIKDLKIESVISEHPKDFWEDYYRKRDYRSKSLN